MKNKYWVYILLAILLVLALIIQFGIFTSDLPDWVKFKFLNKDLIPLLLLIK